MFIKELLKSIYRWFVLGQEIKVTGILVTRIIYNREL
jgi:hypothetical protein